MARIHRVKKDGSLLVGFRPGPKQDEVYVTLRDQDEFERFCLHEKQAKRLGGAFIPDQLLAGSPAAPWNEVMGRTSDAMTFREWMGTAKAGEQGAYFRYTQTGKGYRKSINQIMKKWVHPYLGTIPMDLITQENLISMVTGWLVCPACAARALCRGLDLSSEDLGVHLDPFDGECVEIDEDGSETSSHYLPVARETLITNLKRVRTAFQLAIKKRLFGITLNPGMGVEIPKFGDRPNDGTDQQALSARQLGRLVGCSPPQYALIPDLASVAMLRPSEWAGISIGDFFWSSGADDRNTILMLRAVYIAEGGGKPTLRTYGKTTQSLGPVSLPPSISDAVRLHMDSHRSTPNPSKCGACRDGLGHWYENSPNPHIGCDFSDSAPLFVGPEGDRLASAAYAKSVWPGIRLAAGLAPDEIGWRVDPRHFRSTGATLALEAGVAIDVVAKMGRWKTREILEKHYIKVRVELAAEGAVELGDFLMRERGVEVGLVDPGDRRVANLQSEVARLEAENLALRVLVVDLGGDPDADTGNRRLGHRRLKQSVLDDVDRVRVAAAGARSRSEILTRLGVKRSRQNMNRLSAVAARAGIDISCTGSPGGIIQSGGEPEAA
jgi:integrase